MNTVLQCADVVGHLGVLCMLQDYKNSVRTYPFSRGYKLILLAQFAIIMLFLKSDRSDDKPGNNKWTECMRWILNVA